MDTRVVFARRQPAWLILAVLMLLGVLAISLLVHHQVNAASRNLSPNEDVEANWTAEANCSGGPLYECVNDDPNNPDTDAYMRTQSDQSIVHLGTEGFDTERGATDITVHVFMRNDIDGEVNDLETQVVMPGGNTTVQAIVYDSTDWAWQSVSWSGPYSQNDINNIEVRMEQIEDTDCALIIIFCTNQGVDTIDVATMYVEVDYIPYPELDQNAFRLYENDDSVTPGSPLGATNEDTDIPGEGSPFRLRMLTTVNTNDFAANEFDYHLQIAENETTCSEANFDDVETDNGAIRFLENPSVTDGATVSTFADDPDTTNTVSSQTYNESNLVNAANDADIGDDLLWDFSLIDHSAEPGDQFCFRLAYDDGTPLASYSEYPVVTAVSDLIFSMVDEVDEAVIDPNIDMSTTVVLTECQTSTGELGVEDARIKVTNNLVTNGWGLNIAATEGPTALWSAGTPKYDFNDPAGSPPGCAAGTDSDTYAGQMTIDPSVSTITTEPECSTVGISTSASDAFIEDTNDIINLITANQDSERFCDFYVEGIGISQTIPSEQPMGEYSIDMTITIVAY